jgi:hypothetical protein
VVWQFWGRAAGRPELKSSGRFFISASKFSPWDRRIRGQESEYACDLAQV